MEILPGEYRQARYEGQSRIVKVICSSGENPGYWVVEDVISHSQFKLPTSAFDRCRSTNCRMTASRRAVIRRAVIRRTGIFLDILGLNAAPLAQEFASES